MPKTKSFNPETDFVRGRKQPRPEFRALADIDPYGDPAVLINSDEFFLFITEVGYTCTQDERGVLRIMPNKYGVFRG